jgi:DNA-binding XRE family transcriptional regulator
VLVGGYVKKRTDTPADVLRLMRARLKEVENEHKKSRARVARKKVDELDLRREVEDELAQILIEHKIANLRKSRGLIQAALARRSGVSRPMIAQIESGKLNNLTLKTLARTARALGASLKIDLISRSEPGERGRNSGTTRRAVTSRSGIFS